MDFCREYPAYKIETVAEEVSALTWQRWQVLRASRQMAEDKNNLDWWPDDGESFEESQSKPKENETERDVEIRKFIAGGKSGGGY